MSSSSPCCPGCGTSLTFLAETDPHTALLEAQKRIADLEVQVQLLNKKATAAVDRWADYEDELSRLRAASMTSASTAPTSATAADPQTPGKVTAASATAPSPRASGFFNSAYASGAASRLSQLLSPSTPARKSAPPPPAPQNLAPGRVAGRSSLSSAAPVLPSLQSPEELMAALSREKSLRVAAEGRLNETSREVEELSVTLFEQANEMVASERRARAALEERVGVLERRDEEKKGRLERLEGAVGRMDRISRLLGEDQRTSRRPGSGVGHKTMPS